jgi:hypothetical protein
MRPFWKSKPETDLVKVVPVSKEQDLAAAEKRANKLYDKVEGLAAVVLHRDEQNNWGDSVNQLFLGGGGKA